MSKKVHLSESSLHIYMAENNLLNEEIIASTRTIGECYLATDPSQPIGLYINHFNIVQLLDASVQVKSIPHIKAAIASEFFNEEIFGHTNPIALSLVLDCMKMSQEIYNMIKSKVNVGKIVYTYQKINFLEKKRIHQ